MYTLIKLSEFEESNMLDILKKKKTMAWNFNSTPKLGSVGNFGLSNFTCKYLVHELLVPTIAWDAVHLVIHFKTKQKKKRKEV